MKKYIGESFFNPIFHVLPIVTFLLMQDFYGTGRAWLVTLPLTILIGTYILISYKAIFRWFLVSVNVFLLIALTSSYLSTITIIVPFRMVVGELVAMTFMLSLVIYRKYIYRFIVAISTRKISMENNLNELVSVTKLLSLIFAIFAIAYVFVYYLTGNNRDLALTYVYRPYTATIIIIAIVRTIRTWFIRSQLLKEQWLPVLNDEGEEVGSINYKISIDSKQKYIHPVGRGIIIEGNRILMRKRLCTDDISPSLWDNALCNHVKLKENVVDSLRRSAESVFGHIKINFNFLSNYKLENNYEHQFAHLFLCTLPEAIAIEPKNKNQIKWWTIRQITEELGSGIFTDNFLKEFELLKQIGLIYTGKCECECNLRDTVLENQPEK